MKSVEFCYWLQGLFEVAEPTSLNEKQTEIIKRHLNLVFIHEIDEMYPPEQKEALDAAHAGFAVETPENFIASVFKEVAEIRPPIKKSNLPLYMQQNATEAELDAKYGKGVRPRC